MKLNGIDEALLKGAKLMGWRSGGGVLIIRVDSKDNKELGVGEHFSAMDALDLANKGCLSKGKNTSPGKNYVTGASPLGGGFLDHWLSSGKDFKAYGKKGQIVVEFSGRVYIDPPEEVLDKVRATKQAQQWEDTERGYTYEFYIESGTGIRTKVLKRPAGGNKAGSYDGIKTGTGQTFLEALDSAVEAKYVEV